MSALPERADSAAIAQLMRTHGRRMYRTARAILRDDAEAEDAVQDACLGAIRSLHAFQGRSALSTWLVRIVINEALMRRRQSRRRAIAMPVELDPHIQLERVADGAPTPESAAINAQARRRMEACIESLPVQYRAVFMLVGVQEMSAREAATALRVPEATVRTRYFRARALLRESLAPLRPATGAGKGLARPA